METLTISEVARRAGVRASAIRYYESIKLLPPPQRVSGRRRYSEDILRQLSFIQVARAAGLTIAEMQTLLKEIDGDASLSERWQMLARQKLAELEALARKVQSMKMILVNGLNCQCQSLEECMDCIIQVSESAG